VIHKITKKEVIIADPGKGLVKMTPEKFFETWTGVLIFMVPTVKFQKGNEKKGVISRFFNLLLPQKKIIVSDFYIIFSYNYIWNTYIFLFQIYYG